MKLAESVAMALHSLRMNRLRSGLTTLGIVIGVAAVIVLVGLGQGLQAGFNAQFGPLATQVLVSKVSGTVPGGGLARELRDGDVRALGDHSAAPDIGAVSPVVTGTMLAEHATHQYRCALVGARADYLDMANRELVAGSFFTDAQLRGAARVVVLGSLPMANLFETSPDKTIGRTVRIGRSEFKVIGVLAGNGQQDDAAIVPLGAARAYLVGRANSVDQIIVRASAASTVSAAQDEVTAILDHSHNIHTASQRDFNVTALGTLLDKASQFLTYLTLFTMAVAGISLVVGAIGVANIMLVAVTERTREIGIRKALGAPRRAILKQFLIESTMLAGLGGIAGIVLGVGITLAAGSILPRLAPNFGPPQVAAPAIIIAFTVSLVIGAVAGGYPAHRAARLQPVHALRYE